MARSISPCTVFAFFWILPAAVPRARVFDSQLEAHLPRAHALQNLTELANLLAVGRPVAGALRLDGALVVTLRFSGERRES
jgi:hypothetical protein